MKTCFEISTQLEDSGMALEHALSLMQCFLEHCDEGFPNKKDTPSEAKVRAWSFTASLDMYLSILRSAMDVCAREKEHFLQAADDLMEISGSLSQEVG